jgi:hypothetical protein
MADKTVIIKLEVQEAGAISSINALNNSLSGLDKTSEEYAEVLRKIQVEETRLSKIQASRVSSQNNVSKAQASVTKSLNSQTDATGSATAATMELSRIVSDAPYGIRGMANNISQLVSQLGTASIKAGGLGAALKLMIGTLKGPLGVVFLITAAVSALDYFKGAQTKAKDATKEHNDELERQAGLMQNLQAIQDLLSSSVSSVSLDFMDAFKAGVDSLTDKDLLRVLERDIKGITSAFNKLPKEEQNIEGIEILVRKRRELIEEQITEKKIKEELIELEKKYFIYRNLSNNATGKALKEDIESKQRELLATQKSIIDIEDLFKETKEKKSPRSSSNKISPFKTPEELQIDITNNLSAIDKLSRETEIQNLKNKEAQELSLAKTEEDKIRIKQDYASKNLEIEIEYELKAINLKAALEKTDARSKQEEYVRGLDNKLEVYKDSLRDEKGALSDASKKAISLATTESEAKKNASKEELKLAVFGIEEEYAKLFPFFIQLADARRNALGIKGGDDEEKQKIAIEGVGFYIDKYKELASSLGDFLQAESDRELTIEQNKTNALNTELNNRLLNENLSKDERARIQNQIAVNDENLRKKQNIIKKKAFDTQKAFNISLAIANTVSAGISAANATYGGPIAKIAAMTAVIGAGMAQVAIIARQKFQPDSANTPVNTGAGGGGSGSGRAEPSFNIVGRSNENILLNAIQSQFDKPLKAYVVARDVTNQQQLDGIISNTSSI